MSTKLKSILFILFWAIIIFSLFNTGNIDMLQAGNGSLMKMKANNVKNTSSNVPALHKNLNQEPVAPEITRDGDDVYILMTAQITDIEIKDGYTYKAWTFNGQAPGPLLVVNEGDTIHFTLKNMDSAMPHSMDFHAVHTDPSEGFSNVEPNEEGTFVYQATSPGVFMYHCGTDPVLLHIANGMHGMIIVKPSAGYPTDEEVDREFAIIQNEWYQYNDIDDMMNGNPSQVVFSTKALNEGGLNTNGTVGALIDHPLQAKAGEKIRFYVANMGPNKTSSFHVIGSMFDDVYLDGNPVNHLKGMQTVELPSSGGAVVEFTLKDAGEYKFVTHQFNDVQKGAVGKIIAYEGDIPEQTKKNKTKESAKQNEVPAVNNHIKITAVNFSYNQKTYVVQSGKKVTISFSSKEGYHGLSIEEFGVNITGEGKATFVPDKPGKYKIHCNVYCGKGHEEMTATLIVQ